MYQQIVGEQDIPSHTLKRIMAEHVQLYCTIPLPGYNTPMSVIPAHIYDSVPTEQEVKWAVRRLWGHRLGGTSQMGTKDIQ